VTEDRNCDGFSTHSRHKSRREGEELGKICAVEYLIVLPAAVQDRPAARVRTLTVDVDSKDLPRPC
jgi:hypothetical protein